MVFYLRELCDPCVLCFLINSSYNILGFHYVKKDLNSPSKEKGGLPLNDSDALSIFLISALFLGLFINSYHLWSQAKKKNKNCKFLHNLIVLS